MADNEQDKEQKDTETPIAFDPERYVMIARYLVPMEAQMAKGVLESASLECFLHGENANNLLAPAFKARLMVHKKDEDAARKLLDTTSEGTTLPETTDEEHDD
ncbi:putative signal transducing protein [Edaphobacter flagellatus]|uniref:putative signal transducing protein n=1 Tax=Edaphobacter flagellatus TaxID=1933044 RepID=UPI0021B1A4C8|nr:DUF2007 domain-containing protein [Edaphobacter flagellatus]